MQVYRTPNERPEILPSFPRSPVPHPQVRPSPAPHRWMPAQKAYPIRPALPQRI